MFPVPINIVRVSYLDGIIRELKLSRPDCYDALSPAQISAAYDGVGPRRWSEKKRSALTEQFLDYEPCVLLHDIGQVHGVPTALNNMMLKGNLLKVWAKKFGMFRWFKRSAWVEKKTIIPQLYDILTEA